MARITEIRKKLFGLLVKSFFLVLTTGMLFNKVNQAESLDCNLAVCCLGSGVAGAI